MDRITVVIPTIPARKKMRARAVQSVARQTRPADETCVYSDTSRQGAAITRNAALQEVTTPWVAFLDDDDEFMPGHLEVLFAAAKTYEADYVFSWYEVVGGTDPMPRKFGQPFDPEHPYQTTITTLVRTDLAKAVGFHPGHVTDPGDSTRTVGGEDYRFTLECIDAGAKIHSVPVKTWYWHHHTGNTSGLSSRLQPDVDPRGRRRVR